MKRLIIEGRAEAVEIRFENNNSPWGYIPQCMRFMSPSQFKNWWTWMNGKIDIQEVTRDLVES